MKDKWQRQAEESNTQAMGLLLSILGGATIFLALIFAATSSKGFQGQAGISIVLLFLGALVIWIGRRAMNYREGAPIIPGIFALILAMVFGFQAAMLFAHYLEEPSLGPLVSAIASVIVCVAILVGITRNRTDEET